MVVYVSDTIIRNNDDERSSKFARILSLLIRKNSMSNEFKNLMVKSTLSSTEFDILDEVILQLTLSENQVTPNFHFIISDYLCTSNENGVLKLHNMMLMNYIEMNNKNKDNCANKEKDDCANKEKDDCANKEKDDCANKEKDDCANKDKNDCEQRKG